MKGPFGKIIIGIGAVLALLVAAAIAIPLFVDVDKYRPQIVQIANEKLNGKVELGKLSLSLWGQIKIDVAGLSVSDSAGHKVLAVNDVFFHLPFSSILGGSPSLVFRMNHPTVNVIKGKSGQMNVMTLMKPSAPEAPVAATPASGNGAKQIALPAIATQARLTVEMRNALFSYQDELSGLKSEVKDLNVLLKDVSLSRKTQLEIWADLDTRMGKTFQLTGPARITGEAKPEISGGRFDHLTFSAKADLDDLDIAAAEMFHKAKGVPANAELALVASDKEIRIDRFDAKFFNADIKSRGTISNFAAPVVQYSMKSNEIELKPWVELVPMLKEYELGGSAAFDAEVKGPLEKIGYQAQFKLNGLTAKAPKLKAQPRFDGVVKVVTDAVEDITLTMKAPGNDLRVHGKLVSFTHPQMSFELASNELDLDQLIEFPQPAKKEAGAPATGGAAAPGAPASTADFDAMLAPLRENKIAEATSGTIAAHLKMIKAYDVKMTDVNGTFTLKNLALTMQPFSMGLFGGGIKASASMDFKPKMPTYKFNTQIAGLELQQAVASQFHLFKNTLLGKATFEMSGQGQSFNPAPAIDHLSARGKLKVEHATFATIDVAKMVSEGLNKSIDQIGEKVPPLKGKRIGSLPNAGSTYEFISSDFAIANGKFSAPNFVAKAAPNQGIDLKGSTNLGMKDYALDASFEVIDSYNLTRAKDLAPEVSGTRIEHILAEGNGPVRFPVHVGCSAMAPCYSYTEVPAYLSKVALNNVSQAATGRAKSEIKKQIQKIIPNNAPPAIQEGLKKLFGG